MRVLIVHNRYQNLGGEDRVFESESAMLTRAGNEVFSYIRDNKEIENASGWRLQAIARNSIWSAESKEAIEDILKKTEPDIAHFHNTFPLVSPAAYYACREADVPVVQTLHNYRIICPAATLYRKSSVCEKCVGRAVPWPSVVHACYRQDRRASGALAALNAVHGLMGTWQNAVTRYIALTQFAKQKFVEGGLPEGKLRVKPNFIYPDPGPRGGSERYALFIGRLVPEKGLRTLFEAWKQLSDIPLKVVGTGPLRSELLAHGATSQAANIEILGQLSNKDVQTMLRGARALIFPSVWYEGFPISLLEAFALGVPVFASGLGSMQEIISDGRTGRLFTPRDSDELADLVRWGWSNPQQLEQIGRRARQEYEREYTEGRNLEQLMSIYREARESV